MCADNMNSGAKVAGECFFCGADVDADGDAVEQCAWAGVSCEQCNSRVCDQGC